MTKNEKTRVWLMVFSLVSASVGITIALFSNSTIGMFLNGLALFIAFTTIARWIASK